MMHEVIGALVAGFALVISTGAVLRVFRALVS